MVTVVQMFRKLTASNPLALIGVALFGALIVICIVALIGGFQSMKERMGFVSSQLQERERIVKSVKITGTNSDLRVNYIIESDRLIQYPERGISKLESPVFTENHSDGRKREITAQKGTLIESANLLELVGQIEIVEWDSADESKARTLRSDNLVIDLNLPE